MTEHSNAIKILSADADHYRIGGYGVLYGGRDLDGETFSADTDYNLNLVPHKPVYYDHAQRDIKTPLGYVVNTTSDDEGIWVEAELSRSSQYIDRVMALVTAGRLGWSSGSVAHLAQRESGVIKHWPIVEFSLTPTPAEPRTLGVRELKNMDLGEAVESLLARVAQESDATADSAIPSEPTTQIQEEEMNMSEEIRNTAAVEPQADAVLDAIKSLAAQVAAQNEELKAIKAAEANIPANNPGVAPAVIVDTDHWRYDNIENDELAIMAGVLGAAKADGRSKRGYSAAAAKALAMRLDSDEARRDEWARVANQSVKSAGIKANEISQSTLANYGDEWIGVAYSGALWQKVREATFLIDLLPQIEFPAGAESLVIPLEGADPTWYKVAQAASLTSNPGGIPTNTVTASQMGTSNQTMSLAKMGARVLWTGELEEDAILPYVAELRRQLAVSGAETLEHVLLDGDTATGATTNINDIAGTPGGSEAFLMFDGIRKLPLVTLTANSRDGGALDIEDYLETVKLMGAGGISGYDQQRVAFIVDRHTMYKTLTLKEVKTRDVFGGATIEGGRVASIWGYPVYMSGQVARLGGGKTNASGKVDLDTVDNNTKGQIIAVRPDRWRFGWRRRMTIETTRVPAADSTEIVALMRVGFKHSVADDAAAISYNLTV